MSDGLAAADRYFVARDFRKCLAALEQAGGGALRSPRFWLLRAECLRLLQRTGEARATAKAGLQEWPEHIPLLDSLGLTLMGEKDYRGADRVYRDALALDPDHPFLLAHHAMTLARLGAVAEARAVIDDLGRIAPDALVTLEARADVGFQTKDASTERYVRDLLAVDPENHRGHILRGNLALRSKSARRAARAFSTAAEIDPTNTSVAKAARASRLLAHPLLTPSRRILMLGRWRAQAIYIVVLITLFSLHLHSAASAVIVFWIVFVAVIPRVLRFQQRRRYGKL